MDTQKKLVLFGAGGMGREVAGIVEGINHASPTYELLGFLVSETDWGNYQPDALINGYPLLGTERWMLEHKDDVYCCCTIGNSGDKARVQRFLTQNGVRFETIRALDVWIPPSTTVGSGCVFYPRVMISVDCRIGDGVLFNSCVTLGHDTEIGDYSCIMPSTGISGSCRIGTEVDIGGHAYIIPGRKIGNGARVAAGSIVFSNVKAGTTVLGNPAKRMACLENA